MPSTISPPTAMRMSTHLSHVVCGTPSVGDDAARNAARPAPTATVPAHSRGPSRRPRQRTASGTANRSPVTSSGCTSASGPNARARACRANDPTSQPIPNTHLRRWARSTSSRHDIEMDAGASRAALCCSTEPTANVQPAASAAITDTANTWGALPYSSFCAYPAKARRRPLPMTLLLAFASSLFFAAAYVLQYHEAHEAPRRLFLSPRLLVELAHHRIWVGGIIAMLVGDGLQAAALGLGSLAVVEPVLTASLLFALPISAAWGRDPAAEQHGRRTTGGRPRGGGAAGAVPSRC